MQMRTLAAGLAALALVAAGCKGGGGQATVQVDTLQLAAFAPLPEVMVSAANPITDAKTDLGRRLFFETQLSAANNISCNNCHALSGFGADTGAVSSGHRGKKGGRNSPTVYNAAGHFAQFWDGRAADVEAQALGPILNPVEMAMPAAPAVLNRLKANPEYRRLFAAAFPGERDPMTYENLGRAIGAFERKLVTPARWDHFLHGVDSALTPAEKEGFNTFTATGCQTCHLGAFVGGSMYQKAGLMRPWPDTADVGREAITHQPSDRMVFKVPALRNIVRTAPYFHDGAVRSLDTAVVWMARHQLGKELTAPQVAQIVAWLGSLTGQVPSAYVTPPQPAAATP
jgi:cytochrome c peroxidase